MKKIDLNLPFLQLDGTETKDESDKILTLGQTLSKFLVGSTKGDALKYYDWAVALHKGESINVDASDFKKIRDFVADHEHIYIIAKAQILKVLDSIKDSE